MAWIPYKPSMPINGKYFRIAGRPGQYNEAKNYYDGRSYKLPAGLVGLVQSISPFKIKFDRSYGQNPFLWKDIKPAWLESSMYVDLHATRLNAVEVGEAPNG